MPFDTGFNAAVMTIANRLFPTGYDVGPDAPTSLEALTDHIARTGRMLVWDGASDDTIFGCPEHNWAFRAWHDWCHWRYQLPFTIDGERAACAVQQSHIHKLYGRDTGMRYARLVEAEVVGQALYQQQHGEFPANQRQFVENYLSYNV